MQIVLAVVVGVLYATGIYMMLRRSMLKLIIGLAILSHGANLLILAGAGIAQRQPPIIVPGTSPGPGDIADPLPQALILTAIVINFAVLIFTVVLFHRTYRTSKTDDLDRLRGTDITVEEPQ